MRFSRGPSFTKIFDTTRSSVSTFVSLSSALAAAERTSFSRSFAHVFFVKRRIESASLTFRPRTRSATRRTFCGEAFKYLSVAVASIVVSRNRGLASPRLLSPHPLLGRRRSRLGGLLDLLAAVSLERTRERELTELVPDHVLGDVHRHELAAVVDGQRVADHFRGDRRAARPGLDDLLVALAIHRLDLLGQMA